MEAAKNKYCQWQKSKKSIAKNILFQVLTFWAVSISYVFTYVCRTGYCALQFQGHMPYACMSLQIKWHITSVIAFDHEDLGVSVLCASCVLKLILKVE